MRFASRPLLALLLASSTFVACAGGGNDSSPTVKPRAATPWTTASPQPALPTVEIAYDGGTLVAEVATTAAQRSKGLGGRVSMDADAGMLFDLGDTRIASYWMKDTLIPLDMLWITEDRVVAGIAADIPTEPGVAQEDLARWESPVPVRYVLELNAGESARRGIKVGDDLRW